MLILVGVGFRFGFLRRVWFVGLGFHVNAHLPKLALGPLFVIWFGSGILPTIVITALICFFPLLENTLTAIQHVDPQKRELFRMLGATPLQTLRRLKIASGLPVIRRRIKETDTGSPA